MTFFYVTFAVFMCGTVCRAVAAGSRVSPPRRFRIVEQGWWFPPAPAAIEFATPRARSLEVWGRALMVVGAWLMLFATLALPRSDAPYAPYAPSGPYGPSGP